MGQHFQNHLEEQLAKLKEEQLFKEESPIQGAQGAWVTMEDGRRLLNLCANQYLGLANHPILVDGAKRALRDWGYGMASVRFICGTQVLHRQLEDKLSAYLGMEDTILYSSCFDANTGLFETLLDEQDAVISDALNHASIIDGIRLCKAQRHRYPNADMKALEEALRQTQDRRFRLIATDGVFSMDGRVAPLGKICELADRYDALVMVDDSHGVGFMGPKGRGTHEAAGVMQRVDILTGTLGKALGGASGGYVSSSRSVVQWLRQRSRPYLFSNALAPCVVGATLEGLALLEENDEMRLRLWSNTDHFRSGLERLGYEVGGDRHPIIPILLGEAGRAKAFAAKLLESGLYVTAFSYPVVPEGKARIRLQMSAAHDIEDLDMALEVFEKLKA